MAMNLRSLGKPSESRDKGEAARAAPRAEPRRSPEERLGPPPADGTWDDVLEWASEGALEPMPEDVALAWHAWTDGALGSAGPKP